MSLAYTFADAKAPSRHTTQYFEIFGNRAIYHDGWLAGTVHRAAWEFKPAGDARERHRGSCTTRGRTSAWRTTWPRKNPEKLKELQDLFLQEAVKYSVLPLDDRTLERLNAALVGRPDLMAGRTSLTVLRGHDRDVRERLHQHEEPVAHDHRRGGDSEAGGQRRDPSLRPGASAAGAST